jgi:hypothetical protein
MQLRDATTHDPQRDPMSGDHLEVCFPKRDLKRVVVKLRRALVKQASRETREALALLEHHLDD